MTDRNLSLHRALSAVLGGTRHAAAYYHDWRSDHRENVPTTGASAGAGVEASADALRVHPIVAAWFRETLGEPSGQRDVAAIAAGPLRILAPTGTAALAASSGAQRGHRRAGPPLRTRSLSSTYPMKASQRRQPTRRRLAGFAASTRGHAFPEIASPPHGGHSPSAAHGCCARHRTYCHDAGIAAPHADEHSRPGMFSTWRAVRGRD